MRVAMTSAGNSTERATCSLSTYTVTSDTTSCAACPRFGSPALTDRTTESPVNKSFVVAFAMTLPPCFRLVLYPITQDLRKRRTRRLTDFDNVWQNAQMEEALSVSR